MTAQILLFIMDDILLFFTTYEVWVYALLGAAGIFVLLRKLIPAWKEWRNAVFGIEKEMAQRRLSLWLSTMILLLLLAVVEFSLVSFVAPEFPSEIALPTPTLDLLATETPTVSEAQIPTEEVVEELQPELSGELTEGCVPGQIEWVFPSAGEQVSGIVDLQGIVNVPNLGFFKYEFSQPGSDGWVTIAAGNVDTLTENEETNQKEFVGVWNAEQLVPGDYLLRLVITDNQNQLLPVCVIPIRVVAP